MFMQGNPKHVKLGMRHGNASEHCILGMQPRQTIMQGMEQACKHIKHAKSNMLRTMCSMQHHANGTKYVTTYKVSMLQHMEEWT